MDTPLTNIHMHIFTSECAPPSFLRSRSLKALKIVAIPVKLLLENQSTRFYIWLLKKHMFLLSRADKSKVNRVIAFLYSGTQVNQENVFNISLNVARNYDKNSRLMAQTLDMDFMDNNSKPLVPYVTQLYEVKHVKENYPDNIFPFICADPRSNSGIQLVNWIRYYFENGVKSKLSDEILPYCSGIKLYPAHGFFPFDPRLDELYKYAEEKRIPLMFHCTRLGSQYIGSEIENLIPRQPEMIMPAENNVKYSQAQAAQQEIFARIERYYQKKGWIKNSKIGVNEYACDLFSHPQNYIPVMCKYPNIKICLAHMGGSEEVEFMHLQDLQTSNADKKLKEIWKTDQHNWASLIKNLMGEHENLYTDISSTITDLDNEQILINIIDWLKTPFKSTSQTLGDRVLFGTDFYLSEISKSETDLYGYLQSKLPDYINKMCRQNINNYLA
jgi:uncharacterized protein